MRLRRQLERVVGDPTDADAGEHRLLDGHLVGEPAVQPAPDLAVLALDVLAYDDQVDLSRPRAAQRALDALEDGDRPQVDVLPERPPDRDQQPPQRHVVGHPGPADRAEQDRVVPGQPVQPVVGHHRAAARRTGGTTSRTPRRPGRGRGSRASASSTVRVAVDHLGPDPVAGDDRDGLRHDQPPRPSTSTISGSRMMMRIAPRMSKVNPDRIILVIGHRRRSRRRSRSVASTPAA